jgi:7-carboxy-7-deazaguanine synthase
VRLYPIAEMFYSLQSEGVHAGTPAVFIRFAGRNPKPRKVTAGFDGDIEFPVRECLTVNEVAKLARICNFRCEWVVLTGGEPALQMDGDLVDALHEVGFRIAIETNGTIGLDRFSLDWVTVSPEPGVELHVGRADEIRYVLRHGDPIPFPPISAGNYVLSPANDGGRLDPEDLEWCVQLVKDNPRWRLSVQQHLISKIG